MSRAREARLVNGPPPARLQVALFHGLPPGGALRALYEVLKRFPPDLQVDLFAADLTPVDRFSSLGAGTYHLDLPGLVASTRSYQLPRAVRLIAPRLGRIGTFVVAGEAMRPLQRRMARDINRGNYDVAFVHACRFSLSVPIAEWLTVPCVFYAQETRRVGFEAQPYPPASRQHRRERLIRLLRRPYESVCRQRDRHAVAAVDRVLCNSRFSADMLTAAYGVDPVVCYLGVDDTVFSPPKELQATSTAPPASPLRVLSVGASFMSYTSVSDPATGPSWTDLHGRSKSTSTYIEALQTTGSSTCTAALESQFALHAWNRSASQSSSRPPAGRRLSPSLRAATGRR
jgi:hypothetical protein